MKTGSQGIFVISWSQTEADGIVAAPFGAVTVGAAWRWTGTAQRLDGPQGHLRLDGAEGMAEVRRRAARRVRCLIGVDLAQRNGIVPLQQVADPLPEQSFVVTDGTASFVATRIDGAGHGPALLVFVDAVPPPDCDLWVVRVAMDIAGSRRPDRAPAGMICFTPGTLLDTETGPRLIQSLRPGDRILTRDDGPQPLLWIGQRHLSGARLHAMPHLRPIRLRAHALGRGRPDPDLLVSPQHRMLLRGPAAQALFNTDEVLVAAGDLVNDTTITADFGLRAVTYLHVLLERHSIVWANGLETESFHPAGAALDGLDPVERAALDAALPGVAQAPHAYGDFARRPLAGWEAAILRHDLGGGRRRC